MCVNVCVCAAYFEQETQTGTWYKSRVYVCDLCLYRYVRMYLYAEPSLNSKLRQVLDTLYVYTCVFGYMYMYMYMNYAKRPCAQPSLHRLNASNIFMFVCVHSCVRMFVCVHVYAYTYIHSHTYIQTHKYIPTHT